MKIEINIDENQTDTKIQISCPKLTPEIEKMLAAIRVLNKQLVVKKEEETLFLDIYEVAYVEAIERKTFVYTRTEVYETDYRLYELEKQLEQYGFFRASKSCIIQLKFIKSLKADINRRLRVTLENGEQLIVSRQYAELLKERLGVK